MGRYTQAYSHFMIRLAEIDILLKLAEKEARGMPLTVSASRANALCRAGVVLLSSHIEGFVEELGEVALDHIAARNVSKAVLAPKLKYHLSRDLVDQIRKVTDPQAIVTGIDNLLSRDGHIWSAVPNYSGPLAVQVFVGDFVNPTHERIRKFFGRFGYDQFERDVAGRLTASYGPCKNMVDQVIEQRNRIAHGDTVTTGTPVDLKQMIQLIKLYCREVDCAVADWFRGHGCPIR